jgi:hypothetical protein
MNSPLPQKITLSLTDDFLLAGLGFSFCEQEFVGFIQRIQRILRKEALLSPCVGSIKT